MFIGDKDENNEKVATILRVYPISIDFLPESVRKENHIVVTGIKSPLVQNEKKRKLRWKKKKDGAGRSCHRK